MRAVVRVIVNVVNSARLHSSPATVDQNNIAFMMKKMQSILLVPKD